MTLWTRLVRSDRSVSTFETTPDEITPEIPALCGAMGALPPSFVAVAPAPGARPGWCFANVDEAISKTGGVKVHGHLIWAAPGWLNAEFHAVLRRPGGELVDVTPKADGETRVVFAEDPRYTPDFDFFTRPGNRRVRTYLGRSAQDRARDHIYCYSTAELKMQEKRAAKSNLPLVEYVARRMPPDELERTIDAYLACADEADSLMVPGPSGMTCRHEGRLLELEIRKMALRERIQRAWSRRFAPNTPSHGI
jgi:hypothetical protein